jgi:hypothetical protein
MAGSGAIDDLFDYPHARRTDVATSHEAAASINITKQALQVLRAYADGVPRTDHDACRVAGLASHQRQRCSDLRHVGFIVRTSDRGITPSGNTAFKCMITALGQHYLKTYGKPNTFFGWCDCLNPGLYYAGGKWYCNECRVI